MALDPADRRPLYIQIVDALRREIRAGTYKPGQRIPSARQFQETYGVSQDTALKVLRILEAEGLIDVRKSLGAVVSQKPRLVQMSASYVTRRGDRPRASWRSSLAEQGLEGGEDLASVEREAAPPEIGDRLQLDERATVVIRRRVMLVMVGRPRRYQLANSYYPLEVAAGTMLEGATKIKGGTIAALTALGFEPVWHREELTFRPANADEQRALEIPGTIWIVRILRTSYAAGDRPVEVADMILPADRHQLTYDLPAVAEERT